MQSTHNWHDRHRIARPYFLSKLPLVELEITRGQAQNKRRRILESTYLLGTGRECDLVLGDPQFAEVHAYLLLGPEGVMLRHLGFDPELTVNGEPVHSVLLVDNARIRTGPFEFKVRIWPHAQQGDAGEQPRDIVVPDALDESLSGGSVSGRGLTAAGTSLSGAELRVFRGGELIRRTESRKATAAAQSAPVRSRPPAWPHYSQLILSS